MKETERKFIIELKDNCTMSEASPMIQSYATNRNWTSKSYQDVFYDFDSYTEDTLFLDHNITFRKRITYGNSIYTFKKHEIYPNTGLIVSEETTIPEILFNTMNVVPKAIASVLRCSYQMMYKCSQFILSIDTIGYNASTKLPAELKNLWILEVESNDNSSSKLNELCKDILEYMKRFEDKFILKQTTLSKYEMIMGSK